MTSKLNTIGSECRAHIVCDGTALVIKGGTVASDTGSSSRAVAKDCDYMLEIVARPESLRRVNRLIQYCHTQALNQVVTEVLATNQ
jgi:hypothetical protein